MVNVMRTLRENFEKYRDVWKVDLLIILLFLATIIGLALWQPELPNRLVLDELVERYGGYGPLVIIGIIVIEVIIAPIPGYIVPFVVGALYGVWEGLLYTWIGNVAGSMIAFWIARRLGRPIVRKIISENKIKNFDSFLHRNKLLMWIVYIFPIFPVDIISFTIGFSAVTFRRFVLIVSLGFIPNLLLMNFFGDEFIFATGSLKTVYILVVMVITVVAFSIERIVSKKDAGV